MLQITNLQQRVSLWISPDKHQIAGITLAGDFRRIQVVYLKLFTLWGNKVIQFSWAENDIALWDFCHPVTYASQIKTRKCYVLGFLFLLLWSFLFCFVYFCITITSYFIYLFYFIEYMNEHVNTKYKISRGKRGSLATHKK